MQQLSERFSFQRGDHGECRYLIVFRADAQIRVALEAVLEPGDFQNLAAIFVEIDELDLAEQILAAAFHPEEGFEPVAVDEAGFLEVDHEIDDAALLDLVFEAFLGRSGGLGHEIALNFHHADLAVFLALDGHDSFRFRRRTGWSADAIR